jgi:hypothetical protein
LPNYSKAAIFARLRIPEDVFAFQLMHGIAIIMALIVIGSGPAKTS